MKTYAEHSDYLGHPILKITTGKNDKSPLVIGLRKAEMILESIGHIRSFVDMNSRPTGK
jgi:hypothetical protein